MAKTIWKFPLRIGEQKLEMPAGAEILCLATQRDVCCLWAIVEVPARPAEIRKICVYGTGHDLPDVPGTYIGTFMIESGTYVFHVFEASQV